MYICTILVVTFGDAKNPKHDSLRSSSSTYVRPARTDLRVYCNPDNYKKFTCVILRLTFLSDDHICDHVITNVIIMITKNVIMITNVIT